MPIAEKGRGCSGIAVSRKAKGFRSVVHDLMRPRKMEDNTQSPELEAGPRKGVMESGRGFAVTWPFRNDFLHLINPTEGEIPKE